MFFNCSCFGYYILTCITTILRIFSRIFLIFGVYIFFDVNNIDFVFTFITSISLTIILTLEIILLFLSLDKNFVTRIITYGTLTFLSLIIILCTNYGFTQDPTNYTYINILSIYILLSEIISGFGAFTMIIPNIYFYKTNVNIFQLANGYTLYQFAKLQLEINKNFNLKITSVNDDNEIVTLELIKNNIV